MDMLMLCIESLSCIQQLCCIFFLMSWQCLFANCIACDAICVWMMAMLHVTFTKPQQCQKQPTQNQLTSWQGVDGAGHSSQWKRWQLAACSMPRTHLNQGVIASSDNDVWCVFTVANSVDIIWMSMDPCSSLHTSSVAQGKHTSNRRYWSGT